MKKTKLNPDNPHPYARMTIYDPATPGEPLVIPADRAPDDEPESDGTLSAADRAAINRENALKSTGPRTENGKARSRLNSFRHGLTGQTLSIYEDDWEAYCLFALRLFESLKPVGAEEENLVQNIVQLSWHVHVSYAQESNSRTLDVMDPYQRFEADGADFGPIEKVVADIGALRDDCTGPRALGYLSRNRSRDQRAFHRMREQLRTIQTERRERDRIRQALIQLHRENYNPNVHGPFDDQGFSPSKCPPFTFYLGHVQAAQVKKMQIVAPKKKPPAAK